MSRPTTSRSRSTPRSRWSGRCWSRASRAPARPCWRIEIAKALGAPLIEWHVKSTTKAHAGPLRIRRGGAAARRPARRRARPRHPQLHQARQAVGRLHRRRAAGAADRRDRQGRHRVSRTTCCRSSIAWSSTSTRPARRSQARRRPIVVITSNNEKELPDAFLRRCFFHYIRFPDRRDDAGDRRRAFPRHQAAAGRRGAASCSTRSATCRA